VPGAQWRVLRLLLAGTALLFWAGACIAGQVSAKPAPYATSGTCDGSPKIAVTTAPGICVGLLASGFKFPRGILPLGNGDVMVVDMGGWQPGRGSLWLLNKSAGYKRERLLDKLDRPHGIALGPDRRVYLGVAGGVVHFDPAQIKTSFAQIIGGKSGVPALPTTGRHPLVNLVFGNDGHLYLSTGSASDNCEGPKQQPPDPKRPCAEAEGEHPRGAIRQYWMQWPQGTVIRWSTYATGLRNPLALAVHAPSGVLLQAENGRDNIHRHIPGMDNDEDLPHDELNVIEPGANYGWPYCYDNGKPSPEYPGADCAKYHAPLLLLPAHAAPLGMTYYLGSSLPQLQGKLIVGYHGYRKAGHRVVVFDVDAQGRAQGAGRELISGWDAGEGRPLGAPTDLKTGADGAIYMTEDRNGTVLRIAPDRK
jgi:glucose/arabinose dehydrogenase